MPKNFTFITSKTSKLTKVTETLYRLCPNTRKYLDQNLHEKVLKPVTYHAHKNYTFLQGMQILSCSDISPSTLRFLEQGEINLKVRRT